MIGECQRISLKAKHLVKQETTHIFILTTSTNQNEKFKNANIGNLNVDLAIDPLSQTPEWGKEKVVRYSQLRVSGQVGYAALALANLGVEVNLIANVEDDYYGRFILIGDVKIQHIYPRNQNYERNSYRNSNLFGK